MHAHTEHTYRAAHMGVCTHIQSETRQPSLALGDSMLQSFPRRTKEEVNRKETRKGARAEQAMGLGDMMSHGSSGPSWMS